MEEASSNSGYSGDEVNKIAQCLVTSSYRAGIGGRQRLVTVAWNKNLMSHSFSVTVERFGVGGEGSAAFKVELKPWPFWGKKGFKTLDVDGERVEVFWDLRSAKFSGGSPEPTAGYYVAFVSAEEVVLLLGDCKKDAYKKTKSRPALEEAAMVLKRENIFGKKCFTARAQLLIAGHKDHGILIDSTVGAAGDPEMWISIDGTVRVHVKNLHWKFRGNETVTVQQSPVQVFWDVHDWLFRGPGSPALFIFKPGAPPEPPGQEVEDHGSAGSADYLINPITDHHNCDEFCYLLYAWKME